MHFLLALLALALAAPACPALLATTELTAAGHPAPPLRNISILALTGSLRKHSANAALARAAAASSPSVTLAPRLDGLPYFDADLEAAPPLPPPVAALRAQALAADAFIFATPEYNGAPSGVFKNAYDWLSRAGAEGASPLKGKPFAMLSAGGSSGGARAQRAIVAMVGDVGMVPVGGVGAVAVQLWDGVTRFDATTGELTDEGVRAKIAALVRELEAAAAAAQ